MDYCLGNCCYGSHSMSKGRSYPPPVLTTAFANAAMEQLGGKSLYPQKILQISTDQAIKLIDNFKAGIDSENNQLSQQKLISQDSVQLDTSIYVMEAALNYDFDYSVSDTAFNALAPDTSEFTIPISRSNLKVSSNDVEGAYLQLYQYIESTVSGRTKVKVIDLDAYISGNQVYYRAKVIKNYYWVILKDCTPFQQGEFADEVCHIPSAVTKIEYKLLCCNYLPCPSTWYSNVTSLGISNYSNSTALTNILYYNGPLYNGSQNYCDYTVLSISQLNSYVSNIYNYISTIKPVGSSVASLDLWSLTHPNSQNNYYYANAYWGLNITFGQSSYQGCQ
jgi:hypothetical protein